MLGQKVNLQKSSLYFNATAEDDFKSGVATALSVQQVMNPGHYLGLPTIWGRSRKDTLAYLKERMRDKLLSWRNCMLNNAGKEVLIKYVITTLPTYVMNVFKLPTSWCEYINSMIARFWWGAGNGDRKIHYKRWDTMTLSKQNGGFVFRELTYFNTVLLANTVTRLVSEPDALWTGVLKGMYFPSTCFLQAAKGGRHSWAWASLLVGREVLVSEGVWTVADGRIIQAFKDRWVPSMRGCRLQARVQPAVAEQWVAAWIDTNQSVWDEDAVRADLQPDEDAQVLNMTIPLEAREDKLR